MLELLLLLGLVIFLGFAARWIFERTRVPEVLILLFAGFALGPGGLIKYFVSGIDLQYFQGIAPVVGAVAIISMVFDAGLRLKVSDLPSGIWLWALSAFLNIAACIAAIFGILHFLLGWGFQDSIVLACILGGMSSFAAYSILPLVRTTNSMRSGLYLEGTISTIVVSILAIAFLRFGNLVSGGMIKSFAGGIFWLFSVSFILGLVLAIVLIFVLVNFKVRRFGPFLLFAGLLIIYFLDFVSLGGIGVISIAIVGFVIANAEEFLRLIKKHTVFEAGEPFRQIQGEISIFINTFFFVYLGVIFRANELTYMTVLVSVLLLVGIFVARIAVTAIMGKIGKLQVHENFMSAVMVPRDLLSATLATFIFVYPGAVSFGIEQIFLVIALSTMATYLGVGYYEKAFRNTSLFSKEIRLADGRRVVVRTFTRDDFGKLRKFFNDLVKEDALIAIDQRVSASEEREIDEDSLARMNRKEMIVWIAEHDGKVVGRAVAEKMLRRERDNVSLSFYVSKEFRGAGLGTVLIKMLVKESIRVFSPHNLYLTVYSKNRKAISLYEKQGFVKFGELPDWVKHKDSYLDRVYMVYKAQGQGKKAKETKNSSD